MKEDGNCRTAKYYWQTFVLFFCLCLRTQVEQFLLYICVLFFESRFVLLRKFGVQFEMKHKKLLLFVDMFRSDITLLTGTT
jgi:hypothetical protein